MGIATATLSLNDVEVGAVEGPISDVFSTATVLVGQGFGTAPDSSRYIYDDVKVIRDETNLVANSGFEAATRGGNTTAPAAGNWQPYAIPAGGSTVARTTSPVHAGDHAGAVTIGTNGGYFHQDIALELGDRFCFDLWLYRDYGSQEVELLFDWDRTNISGGLAYVRFPAIGGTEFYAWGLSGIAPALSFDEWHHVELCLSTTKAGFSIGQVGI